MRYIIAVDPGKCTGLASYNTTTREFVKLAVYRPESPHDLADWIQDQLSPLASHTELVVEIPQVYPYGKGKGDPNDLISVALLAGAAMSLFRYVTAVLPRTWKSTTPKAIHNARTLERLTKADRTTVERIPKTLRHNALDAIGLALWYAERKLK